MGDKAEDFLAEPVWPTNPGGDTETEPAGKSGDDEEGAGSGNGTDGGDDEGGSDQDDGESSGEQDPEDGERKPKGDAPADKTQQQPGTRKTKYDFIAERQRRKAEREAAAAKEAQGEGGEDEESDEDGDPVAPEDEATIDKVLRKKYGSQFEAIERQRFDNEVAEFFQKDEVAKHATDEEKARLKEYALHPSRSQIPLESIMLEVMGGKRLMEIGAKIEREAAQKAASSKSGGGSAGRQDTQNGNPDYLNMSEEDFEKEQFRVLTGGR